MSKQNDTGDPEAVTLPPIHSALSTLFCRNALTVAQSEAAATQILQGQATAGQACAYLVGLHIKGPTAPEIAGLVRAIRAVTTKVTPMTEKLIDA